jgi:uncharacterized membrane protein YgaE (UPF0421/DUF939 family)
VKDPAVKNLQDVQMRDTVVQGIEAIACTYLLFYGFKAFGKQDAIWALVSAVIVLRPGFEDSLRASQVRIAANLVGGAVGLAAGLTLGMGAGPIALALFIVILVCYWKPLQPGVRSACAGVVIVMMHEGSVRQSAFGRFSAVVIGCLAAMAIGYLGHQIFRREWFRNQADTEDSAE